jgi:hypothetical protein
MRQKKKDLLYKRYRNIIYLMSQQILFYKKTCPYCVKLFDLLQKSPRLMKQFLIICVDDKRYRIPKQIKSVPSAIITSPTGEPHVFSGTNLFNWIKNRIHSQERSHQPQQQQQQQQQQQRNNPDPRYQQHEQRQKMQQQQQNFKQLEPQEWDSFMMSNLSGTFSFIEEDKNEVVTDRQGYASLLNLNNFQIMTPEDDGMKNKGDLKPVSYSTDDPNLKVPYNQNSQGNPFADSRQEEQYSSTNYNPNQYSSQPQMNNAFDPNIFRDQNYEGNDNRSNSRKSQFDSQMESFKNQRDMGMPQPLRRM